MRSRPEKILLELLAAALGRKEAAVGEGLNSFSGEEAGEFMAQCGKQNVAPLVFPALFACPLRDRGPVLSGIVTGLSEKAAEQETFRYRQAAFLARVTTLLEREGIRPIVLKGEAAASWYPRPVERCSSDMDLLLCDDEERKRAGQLLTEHGMIRQDNPHAAYHEEYRSSDGMIIELHRTFSENFDRTGVDSVLAEVAAGADTSAMAFTALTGRSMYTLRDGAFAFSLLIHMLHHFLTKGFGLRLLCDWTVFWQAEHEDEEIAFFLGYVERSGLATFAAAVTYLCRSYLGLNRDIPGLPVADAAVRGAAENLLDDIFEGGEYGAFAGGRMVALTGSGPASYAAEFHHRMKRNFPGASKIVLLWPALWLSTLFTFLKNNRYRRESVGKILKSAGDRGRKTKDLLIFKK